MLKKLFFGVIATILIITVIIAVTIWLRIESKPSELLQVKSVAYQNDICIYARFFYNNTQN